VLLCVGDRLPLPADVAEPVRFAGTGGYDGPFYALVALDPLDRRPTSPFLDDPGKRYGRILLPALARATGASDLRGVAWRFALLNLLGVAGVAALVAHSRRGDRRAFWIGLAAGAQTGLAVSVARGLPGPVGTALLLLALHFRERNRDLRALACLALAPLDQELFAVVPVVLAAQALRARRGRDLLWLLALAPVLAWRAWVVRHGLPGGIPFADLGLPLLAPLRSGVESAALPRFPPEDLFSLLHLLAFLAIPAALRKAGASSWILASLWLAAACADRDVWIAFWSSARATAPAFVLAAARGGGTGALAAVAAASFTPALSVWFACFPPVLTHP
jgi:hypothetical protein